MPPDWDEFLREIESNLSRIELPGAELVDQLREVIERDPQWVELRRTLDQLAAGVRDILPPNINFADLFAREPGVVQAGLAQAQADLRERLPEIQVRLTEIGQAAEQITADPVKSRVVERISGAVKPFKISDVALLVALWWLFVVAASKDAGNQVAVLALWITIVQARNNKGG
jgi:hypothetical protein